MWRDGDAWEVDYRACDGGRKAPNERVSIGRFERITPDQARRIAQGMLGRVAMPTLAEAFEGYMDANPKRKPRTVEFYRQNLRVCFGDWVARPLDRIDRRDIEARFNRITEEHGWAAANQTISMLRAIYRRSCIDHEGLRNPVELWIAGGSRFNAKRRRHISPPDEVLPRWRAGV